MDDQQLLRYSRQIMLPEVDIEGQQRLLEAHVMIVGLGGLGSPAAMYLASAGLGCMTLLDFDDVDLSNLQRQIIHHTADIGRPKVESARDTIGALNSSVKVNCYKKKMAREEVASLLDDVDIILDCSDNFETRYTLNELAVTHTIPLVSGAAIGLEGQISVFDSRKANAACYRCLYPEGNEQDFSCAENGVLGPVVGIIASMQALECIKIIVGFGETLSNRLLVLDGKRGEWRSLNLRQDKQCPVCQSKTENQNA